MSGPVTIRTRKFLRNSLLSRHQMVVDVHHLGKANVSKQELSAKIAEMYKVSDPQLVICFGFRTQFGGGRSTGFALIYDKMENLKKYEPKYRQIRAGVLEAKQTSRKQIKETKNRNKKVRGTGKRMQKHKTKRANR